MASGLFFVTRTCLPHLLQSVINGTAYPLTKGYAVHDTEVAWAPDSRCVAFLSDRSGSNQVRNICRFAGSQCVVPHPPPEQVWLIDIFTLKMTQLTFYPVDIDSLKWSKTGNYVCRSLVTRHPPLPSFLVFSLLRHCSRVNASPTISCPHPSHTFQMAFSASIIPGKSMAETAVIMAQKAASRTTGVLFDHLMIRHWDTWYTRARGLWGAREGRWGFAGQSLEPGVQVCGNGGANVRTRRTYCPSSFCDERECYAGSPT